MVEFLDTNVLIRHITQDQPDQATRAGAFFDQVETGEQTITTCEGVLVEAVQVLSSRNLYNRPRTEIREYLTRFLLLPALRLPHKQTYRRALDLYAASNLDFVDSLAVAHMERTGIVTIVSFDRGFDRVLGVSRREP